MSEDFEELESYRQLPDDGDAVFKVGPALVRFTARHEHGRVSGWTVTTDDPGYEGFLASSRQTDWTKVSPEPMRTYAFEYRGEGSGPQYMSGNPTDVTVEEFGRIYFGA